MTDLPNCVTDCQPPEPPTDEACCNNGCEELCVFEIYKQQKLAWEQRHRLKTCDNKP